MPLCYEFVPEGEPNCYATGLSYRRNKRQLVWDSTPGIDMLMVELPYGDDVADRMESEICPALCERELAPGRYVDILPQVWARRVTAVEKARDGGCPSRCEGRTYVVFALRTEGEVARVSLARANGMISPCCDIPLEIHVGIERAMREERSLLGLRRTVVETDFWRLSFPESAIDDVRDGDLAYRLAGYEIPLTRRVLAHGEAYVKAFEKPDVFTTTTGTGIRLV